LREALESLEENHDFLTAGGVFTEDFLKAYMQLKWDDVHAFEQAPHLLEFKLYYGTVNKVGFMLKRQKLMKGIPHDLPLFPNLSRIFYSRYRAIDLCSL
jgi:myosin-crossreactive antigen